jgi:hypothetical protein
MVVMEMVVIVVDLEEVPLEWEVVMADLGMQVQELVGAVNTVGAIAEVLVGTEAQVHSAVVGEVTPETKAEAGDTDSEVAAGVQKVDTALEIVGEVGDLLSGIKKAMG